MLQDIRTQRHTEIDYITGYLLRRAHHHGITLPENTRVFEFVKRKKMNMSVSALGCLAPGSEETEAVTPSIC